ncbi:CEL [Mytilus coruscus]|uniref:CEL n=1 Tax=Mytilus coruscus TaxID=42192 RepID=A0A6J8E368_MYTCO|nr:CEL [Mytilus coruscus]
MHNNLSCDNNIFKRILRHLSVMCVYEIPSVTLASYPVNSRKKGRFKIFENRTILITWRTVPASNLLKAYSDGYYNINSGFGPTIDGDFIPASPVDMLSIPTSESSQMFNSIDYMAGINDCESAIYELPKVHQDSMIVLYRIEVTHKVLAHTVNAVNMNHVMEDLRVSQAQTRETNKKIDKIDSDLRKNQMLKSHDTSVSLNDQSGDFRGSSIVNDLNGRRIYRNKITRINTLRDKTVYGASQFIKFGKVSAKNVLFQKGSNDLETKGPDEVLQEVEHLVDITQKILPETKIILAEILPRFLRDRNQSKEFEQKRLQFNTLLKDYCFDKHIHLVEYSNMRTTDYTDGIHLNEVGV